MLTYLEARRKVVETVRASRLPPSVETVPLVDSRGRVLAQAVSADRDYPPFHRATRDGYAVRSGDVASTPAKLTCAGEIAAGRIYSAVVAAGQCIQTMTGAPVPDGADAVVKVEHTEQQGESVLIKKSVPAGANVVPRGTEAKKGEALLEAGARIDYPEISLLGQVGQAQVRVYRRPRVAVVSTGDEVVPVEARPGTAQIRNSNAHSMAAQVAAHGGEPILLGNAPDDMNEIERTVLRGLEEDLLVLTGGVSMGKYDLVEAVLRNLGANFFFDAVAIRPGRPAVFAGCKGKYVFGLPGNPVSTMVTFELLVAPALALLSGAVASPLRFLKARLREAVSQPTRLSLFVPAVLEGEGSEVVVRALSWKGSGDVVTMARADCFVVVPESVDRLEAGTWVDVMPRHA